MIRMYSKEGDDVLYGGSGDDVLFGGEDDDVIYGSTGDDALYGNYGFDKLFGGDGDDTYHIWDLRDYIWDSDGNDSAVVSVSFAKIPSYIENVRYVNGARPLPYWIDALLPDSSSGSRYLNLLGEGKTFWYIFPAVPPAYIDQQKDSPGYRQLTETQQNNAVTVLKYLEEIIDVKVRETKQPRSTQHVRHCR